MASAPKPPCLMSEAEFGHVLEVFRHEADAATQFLYAYLAVHEVAADHKAIDRLLNTAPLFWNTSLGALQTALFITLGRIFDAEAKHSVHQLLSAAQSSHHLFSKQALGDRKRCASSNASEWLNDFLRDVHVPTVTDFRTLRKEVEIWRNIYFKNYRDVRRKYFAHREVSESEEVAALFAKTTIIELKQMLAFLRGLHNALQDLFLYGRQPIIRPPTGGRRTTLHGRITSEAKGFLMAAAGTAKRPKNTRGK